jgi:hypothetical protein
MRAGAISGAAVMQHVGWVIEILVKDKPVHGIIRRFDSVMGDLSRQEWVMVASAPWCSRAPGHCLDPRPATDPQFPLDVYPPGDGDLTKHDALRHPSQVLPVEYECAALFAGIAGKQSNNRDGQGGMAWLLAFELVVFLLVG